MGCFYSFVFKIHPPPGLQQPRLEKSDGQSKKLSIPQNSHSTLLPVWAFQSPGALMVPRCCKFQSKFQKLPSKLYPRYPQWCFQVPSSYPYPNRSYQKFLILVSFPCRHTSAWQRWRLPWQSQNRWIIVYANMVDQILSIDSHSILETLDSCRDIRSRPAWSVRLPQAPPRLLGRPIL